MPPGDAAASLPAAARFERAARRKHTSPSVDSGAVKGILGHFLRPATVLWGLRFQSLPELYKEEIACVVGLFFPLYNQERCPQTLTEGVGQHIPAPATKRSFSHLALVSSWLQQVSLCLMSMSDSLRPTREHEWCIGFRPGSRSRSRSRGQGAN